MPENTPRNVVSLGPRTLRALAHPLRIQLLKALRHHGPATASQLADRLGESSGATSYHLRQLAEHGLIEDAPEHGKGRERWWRAAHDGTTFDADLLDSEDPEVRGAANVFMHEVATIHAQEAYTWIGTRHEWDDAWSRASDLSDFSLDLTPEQLTELTGKVHALIESYGTAGTGDATEKVRLHLHAFPRSRG
ncbi:helix-turn-helix domain-containing protein [Streptomyces sp. NPDC001941]|uniref:ArsR/SmtB family transcription factor n=1 Tax=Streptomyces sp. NPDC001941 TaxID=3154659 RepID=UPI0033338702